MRKLLTKVGPDQCGVVRMGDQYRMTLVWMKSGNGFPDYRKKQFRLDAQALADDLFGDFNRGGKQLLGNVLVKFLKGVLQV